VRLAAPTTLTKSGAGILTLSGNSTYSGGTAVSAGVLNAQSNNALGTGTWIVSGGTTLQLQGSGLSVGTGTATVDVERDGHGAWAATTRHCSTPRRQHRRGLNNKHCPRGGHDESARARPAGRCLNLGGVPPAHVPGTPANDTITLGLGANKLTLNGGTGTTNEVDAASRAPAASM